MSAQPALLDTVRAVRRQLAEAGPAFTRAEGDFALISLPAPDGDVLRDFLVQEQARVVIEIGLAYGSSALAIGEALVLQGAGALAAEGFVADAAFVDGSHIFHRVFVDLAFLHELVRPGGLIILDDGEWPSVATAARYFERNAGWQPVVLPASTRLRAFRVPDPRVEPAFEDFKPFHATE